LRPSLDRLRTSWMMENADRYQQSARRGYAELFVFHASS
jgi:hypothetical protein